MLNAPALTSRPEGGWDIPLLVWRAGTPLRDIASFLARPAAARLGQLDAWERDLDAELPASRHLKAILRFTVSVNLKC